MSPPGARDKAQNGDDGPAEDRGLFKVASPDEVRQGPCGGTRADLDRSHAESLDVSIN